MAQPSTCANLLIALFFLTGSVSANAQQNVQISEDNGLLSVKASNTSAAVLAEALSDQLGISVVITGDTEALVNLDIVEEPLDKALGKISPNNLLVRSGKAPDSDIIEVVLIMGEGSQGGSAAGSEQFLPSGSPAEEVSSPEQAEIMESVNGSELRDPNRSQMVRDAANAAASDAGITPEGSAAQGTELLPNATTNAPDGQMFDPVTGLPIDPTTGLPIEQPQQ